MPAVEGGAGLPPESFDAARVRLDGVRALVTGASSGLGLAMARALLDAGATVALASRPGPRLAAAASGLHTSLPRAHTLAVDVRDAASVAAARRWVERRWGGLDVLVNNAGLGMRTVNPRFMVDPAPFYTVSPDGFRAVVDTNLTGYFLVARALAPVMVQAGRGKIVNISMSHSTMRQRGFVPYGPSRAGAESLSLIMAADLADSGVTVNMLLPGGAVDTGMIPEELKDELEHPLLAPDIMGAPIKFLASPASDGITGQRFVATDFIKAAPP